MKVATLMLIMLAIQAAIIITAQGTYNEETPFWEAAQNPTNWQASVLVLLLGSIAAIVGGAIVVVGALLLGKADLAVFAIPVFIMAGWLAPIVSFWRMVTADVTLGGLGLNGLSVFICSLVCGPLIILALYSLLTWWRTTFEG